jgi:preprotein translocase subunit SecA
MFSLQNILKKRNNNKQLNNLKSLAESVLEKEKEISSLSDSEMKEKTLFFKEKIKEGQSLDDILPDAFALVREASKRVLKERHYDTQIIGGVVLHRHSIAEMRTGEGKTLVATLPVYLNALLEKGVHVITVNDYLARRDAVWMGQVYSFLGLSVGIINNNASYLYDKVYEEGSEEDKERDATGSFKVAYEFLRPSTRKEAYLADITYGTNSEFGFDYLRDNIEYEEGKLRQRGHHFALIDEVDSVLIDEARTPLIISSPSSEGVNYYLECAKIVESFSEGEDYTKDEKLRAIQLTDAGIEKAEKALGVENIYTEAGIKYVHHLETAVRAKALFLKDTHYVVRDNSVIIVDEFTGRMQEGRRWSEGLHQAVEAKENVPLQKESKTFASITYQNYFRLYEKLAGMTGTAETSAEEFYSVYKLDVVQVPTHKPIQRKDSNDLVFINQRGKHSAIVKKVKEITKTGQPILIGTASVEENEKMHSLFKEANISHQVLNAKNHEKEGEIIAEAGRRGAVTIATNMAGRGVDIKLGGSPYSEEKAEEIRLLGGLFVLGTERHEARRIDNQLRGRSGRQGDPGETQFYVSLDDHLMRVFGNNTMMRSLMEKATQKEDEPIEHKLISNALETAQKRIEGFNFDSRKKILAYDDVLNKQRHSLYEKRQRFLRNEKEAFDEVLAHSIEENPDLDALIAEKKAVLGEEDFYSVFRRLCMHTLDTLWLEHLEIMDHLRSSVNLRAYGQRDPLIEYKKEGLRYYHILENSFIDRISEYTPKIGSGAFQSAEEKLKKESQKAQATGGDSSENTHLVLKKTSGEAFHRNEFVSVTNGKEVKEMKYKKAEPLLQKGEWFIVKKKEEK